MEKLTNAPALEERVARLEELVAGMAAEVRTRRLVVVDERGRERITAECQVLDERPAEVRVCAADGSDTWAAISAANAMEGGAPSAQVDLSVDGAIHTHLMAAPVPGWWRPERPAHVHRTDVRSELMVAGEPVTEGYSDSSGRPRKADG